VCYRLLEDKNFWTHNWTLFCLQKARGCYECVWRSVKWLLLSLFRTTDFVSSTGVGKQIIKGMCHVQQLQVKFWSRILGKHKQRQTPSARELRTILLCSNESICRLYVIGVHKLITHNDLIHIYGITHSYKSGKSGVNYI